MKRITPIRLDNGIEGILFLRMHFHEVVLFIQQYRTNPKEVIQYNPKKDVFTFGRDSVHIMDGDCIVFLPLEDKFHLTRNPNWISEYDN